MKSFATLALFAASVAYAQLSGVVTYNSTTGVFTCPAYSPNGAFCADSSLLNSIIIRCNNGVGQPGNCNDNLSGEFPGGLSYAPCWETSPTSGDAACSKNCVVYGDSGNANGTFTLPDCIPTTTASTFARGSTASATSLSVTVPSTNAPIPIFSVSSTSIVSVSSTSASSTSLAAASSSSTSAATITATSTVDSTTPSLTYACTSCSTSTLFSVILGSGSSSVLFPLLGTGIGSGSTGSPAPISNITLSTGGSGGASSAGSTPTATPVGPTKSATESPSSFTGDAVMNHAGTALAAIGLVIAYFL